MLSLDLLKESLVHVAALLGVSAMFFRSQLALRSLLLAATAINIVFFLVVPVETLWGPVFWGAVSFVVNGFMIGRLMIDRTMFGLSPDEIRLYRAFAVLSPGEYRNLMWHASWNSAAATRILTSQGAAVDSLYYVFEGEVRVAKNRSAFSIPAGSFIGEVAFLRDTPASATVTVSEGARYLSWDRKTLEKLMLKRPAIRVALAALLNLDMAAKVAAEAPQGERPSAAA